MALSWLTVGSFLHNRPFAKRIGLAGAVRSCALHVSGSQVELPNGFVLADKPIDWTSFDVVGTVRDTLENHYRAHGHSFGRRSRLKVGHGGTLDPIATGALVLGIGHGTKQLSTFLSGPKSYVATARLGFETDTQDSRGQMLGKPLACEHVTQYDLEKAMASFRGEIMQRPPIYSAMRKNGKRM